MAYAPASKSKASPPERPASLGGSAGEGRGPRASPSGGRLDKGARRKLYGHDTDRSPARSRSPRRRDRSTRKGERDSELDALPYREIDRATYDALVEASRVAETEEEHVSLIGQFISATRSARYVKKAIIDSVARHIRKWDITIHDFRGFSDAELQIFMNGDGASGDGVTLAKPGSIRLSVFEAFQTARKFDAMPPGDPPPEGERTPPLSGLPRAESGTKRRRSRRRSSSRRRRRSRGCSLHSKGSVHDSDPLNIQKQKEMLESIIGLARNASKPKGSPFQDVEASLSETFDLATFARTRVSGDHSALDLRWFPDPALILTLKKDIDLCRRQGSQVPYVSRSRVEHWQPQWLGEGKLEGERDRLVRERKRESATSATSVCISSIGFWLAHLAAGQIGTMHILAHTLLLIKLCDERGHAFTAKYQSRLRNSLQIRIQAGESFDLGEAISRVNYDLVREVQVDQTFIEEARRRRREDDPLPRSGRGPREGGGSNVSKSDRTTVARAGKGAPTAAPDHVEKKNICFFHHPAKGLICSRGDACRNEHLDTSVPGKLERFNSAKKRFDEMKASSKKLASK